MLGEVMAALQPGAGSVIVDGTFGAGGYTRALLEIGANVIAIDRDPEAIAAGRAMAEAFPGRLTLVEGRFGGLDEIVAGQGRSEVDGVVLDIGVSSMQIDEAGRGFSFMKDGPLDMRMERSGPSAADVVNRAEPKELTRIIGILGEEKHAGRLARAIAERRARQPFERTLELADLVEATVGRKPGERIHPATRTFQALRIFVNRELEELADALVAAEIVLRAGGRLVVVTFHSLEDRIVKRFLADRSTQPAISRHQPAAAAIAPTFARAGKAAVSPDEAETNPRARSARLRFATRTAAAPRGGISFAALPALASPSRFGMAGGL